MFQVARGLIDQEVIVQLQGAAAGEAVVGRLVGVTRSQLDIDASGNSVLIDLRNCTSIQHRDPNIERERLTRAQSGGKA